jgi:hypothetical protein
VDVLSITRANRNQVVSGIFFIQFLFDVRKINRDNSKAAILDQEVSSLECLLNRFHSTFAASHPQQSRQVDAHSSRRFRIERVTGVHHRTEMFIASGSCQEREQNSRVASGCSCRTAYLSEASFGNAAYFAIEGRDSGGKNLWERSFINIEGAGKLTFDVGTYSGEGRNCLFE